MFRVGKINKYGAKKTPCRQMHMHDSKREAEYCNTVHLTAKASGLKVDIKTQVRFDFVINKKLIGWHIVDFLITNPDGAIEVREVKGFKVRDFALRKRLFCALYPHIKYTVIK